MPWLRTSYLVAGVVLIVSVAVAVGLPDPAMVDQSDESTTVDSCRTISEPGRFVLAENLTNGTEGACIRIEASGVVFDGRGHTIVGGQNESSIRAATNDTLPPRTSVGVSVNASGRLSDVTVRNVTVRGWYYGIVYENVSNVVVRDSVVAGNGVGLYVHDSRDVTTENVVPVDNVHSGIVVESSGVTVSNTTTAG